MVRLYSKFVTLQPKGQPGFPGVTNLFNII